MHIYNNDVLDVAIKEFNYIIDINLNKKRIDRLFSNIPQVSDYLTYETFLLTFGENVPLVDKPKSRIFINHITSALRTKDFRSFVAEMRFINFLSINRFDWSSIKVNFVEEDGDMHAHIVSRDITDEKENEIQVIKSAQKDALTDLYNRNAFKTIATNLLVSLGNTGDKCAFFFLDIDNFKKVNDIFGHLVGDKILIEVSTLLTKILNNESIICRYGGDEFIALIPHIKDIENIESLATSLCSSIKTLNTSLESDSFYGISCSVGVSISPDHSTSLDELTRYADLALYKAKASGKNQFAIYDSNKDYMNITYSEIKQDNKIVNHYALLDKVLLNSDSGILITDSIDYRVLFANKSFCYIFKIPEKDIYSSKIPCYTLIYGLSEPCKNCGLYRDAPDGNITIVERNGRKYTRQTKKVEVAGRFVFISYYNSVITENELSHITATNRYISQENLL